MGQTVSGGTGKKLGVSETEKLTNGIVLTDVVVKKREIIVDIPRIVYSEQVYEKPVIEEKIYERPIIRETPQDTVRYNVVEQETIKYIPKEVPCEKPVITTKEYEKPIIREQVYEKPIIEQKRIEVVTVDNLELVKAVAILLKEINALLPQVQEKLNGIKEYKLIEKVISVPKVEYVTTQVERIEWIDVKRERPS